MAIKVLTKAEISTLPRWACVALAARFARRVQPLYSLLEGVSQKHVDAVDNAIGIAEQAAAASQSPADAVADAAAYAAYAADTVADTVADTAAYAAADAAGAVYAAAYAAYAADAVYAAADAVDAAADAVADAADAVGLLDFEQLKQAAQAQEWTDETPVPPGFFGPLWPDGEPNGWPKQTSNAMGRRTTDEETDNPVGLL